MRRSLVVAVVAGLSIFLVLPSPAGARVPSGATLGRGLQPNLRTIQELDFVFIPDPASAQLGQTLRWVNVTPNAHTSTGAAPLSLWNSRRMVEGQAFTFTFTAGGTFPYLCLIHERFDMISSVKVKDQVSPPEGPVGTVFTVTVASIRAPHDYVYDIQRKDPGGDWLDWMTNVTTQDAAFDSTGFTPGTYSFRSRLHRLSDDASSDYSPPVAVSLTP